MVMRYHPPVDFAKGLPVFEFTKPEEVVLRKGKPMVVRTAKPKKKVEPEKKRKSYEVDV